MTPPTLLKRPTCSACLRPQRTCICQWVRPIAPAVEVLILQHPLEVDNAKGTARLLHLCLANSRLVTGEVFEASELQALLQAPLNPLAGTQGPRHTLLLYPQTPQDLTAGHPLPPVLAPACLRDPFALRLVVLDGTWRKSRKMLALNPLLQQLPRLALRDLPPSRYLIRQAQQADQLSTFEACCAALAQLEMTAAPVRSLLEAFDGFVGQQLAYRNQEHRRHPRRMGAQPGFCAIPSSTM